MKGLFYSALHLNRGYFIGAAAAFLCSAAVGSVVLNLVKESGDTFGLGFLCVYILPLLPIVILSEFFARDLEKNIKSRFLNYTLSSMPRNSFLLSQLIINIVCTGLGLLLGLALLLIYRAVFPSYVDQTLFGVLPLVAVLASVVEWIVFPTTMLMKSAEKAGLTVGIIIGFGIVLPIMTVYRLEILLFDLENLLDVRFLMIFAAAALAVYAGVFAISTKLLKRGVC